MTMSKLEVDAILKEWRFYSDTIKRMLPGNTPALREASAKLGYPLMNAIPGLIERIDDQDRWLEHERNRAARLENQLDGTQSVPAVSEAEAKVFALAIAQSTPSDELSWVLENAPYDIHVEEVL